MSPVEVYQYPDIRPVNLWCTLGLLLLEMLSKRLIDDLGDGQVIEVCLAPDGFDPALFDMEGSSLNADFRELKFTHNGIHVLDGVPGMRKLQCEVFSPLSLDIAGSYCRRLPGSSAWPLEAMMR